nr:PREDICTED: UDP-glycosyltransferase 91A1-like [Daucus carota subsp. sativus]
MACVEKLHIVMFPWLAFGHIFPYLKLAKLMAAKGHKISFVSATPKNIDSLPKIPQNLAPFINLVKMPLPLVPNLPENAESTTEVPFHKVKYLKLMYDLLQEPITRFLESSTADWILADYVSYWLRPIASRLRIRWCPYNIFTASFMGFLGPPSNLIKGDGYRVKPEDFTVKPEWVHFDTNVAMSLYQSLALAAGYETDEETGNVSEAYRVGRSLEYFDMVAIRSSVEFEGDWLKLLQDMYEKPVIPVGLLPDVEESKEDDNEDWSEIKDWLDKQAKGSVLFVAFGSEAKLTQAQTTELALGLELTGLPFFWAMKKQRGLSDTEPVELPEGFQDRTRGRGMIYTTWVPQTKILDHESVSALLNSSGYSSVVEAMQFGKALILLPCVYDQGIIAKQLEEKKLGFQIPRDESDGGFTRESVAESVNLVMLDEEGKIYRDNVKDMQAILCDMDKQNGYVDNLLNYLQNHKFSKN